jgi:hypothetical protein
MNLLLPNLFEQRPGTNNERVACWYLVLPAVSGIADGAMGQR